jgi:predicted deacylase
MNLELQRKVLTGRRAGPRVLITAGVHGDEYVPMLTVRELIRRFETEADPQNQLQGRLTLVPVVNESAFRLGRRCGEDGLDLARSCPGNEDGSGSVTEQTAAALSRLIRDADFYVDLHTGGTEFCVWPLAGYVLHKDGDILEKQRGMAKAFGLPLVWGTSAELEGRSLSVARDVGVPAIYVEYFGGSLESVGPGHAQWGTAPGRELIEKEASAHPMVTGCLNLLRHLGALEGEALQHEPEVIEDHRPQSGHMQICHPAPLDGFFQRAVTVGDWVETGAILGRVSSVLGNRSEPVRAGNGGRVVTLRWHPRVNAGDSVAVVAEKSGD